MPDTREGDLGTTACYLTVERLALQAGVESPFWDETSLLMGGCEGPWYKKPLTPRRLRSFLKRYGGSLPDDDGQRVCAASVFSDVMRLHGIPIEDGADDLGALYVRRAESVGMTKEEIQAELDRQARESMMTISLDMTPTLSADGSKLAVRVANVEENRFNQLIEVEQDGKVIGSYKGLKPGEKLDEIDVTGAKPGAATVTVQAMEDGEPSGNPSGFEVTIAASE